MKDSLEKAYTESILDKDILKIFVAPEFYFRGLNGAYDFEDDPSRLDKIFGYNHTTKTKNNENEVCAEGPVCAILQGLQDLVEDERFQDWFFLFGTVIASQKLPIISNITSTTSTTTTTADPSYEYLYYNFAPIYKGFDPKDEKKTSSKNKSTNKKKKKKKKKHHHYALGKRFLLPKRYISTSDFLTPSRDIDFMNRGKEWEELYTEESQQDKRLDLDIDGGNWVTDNGYDADIGDGVASKTVDKTDTDTDTVVGNPKTNHKRLYDDNWFTSYKHELYQKAGYTMIEYDWLIMDGISMSLEVCLDHQMRSALDTYLGDIITGRTTKIPSSSSSSSSSEYSLEYVSIPTYQAQISLVSSAGMSPNTDSLALCQNGILFVQDGISNKTSRRYIDNELMDTCGTIQTALQYEGGTIGVRRRSLLTKTDVRFEYELLSSTIGVTDIENKKNPKVTSTSAASTSDETAYEYKVPVYDNNDKNDGTGKSNDNWKNHLDGIFSTEVYEPHLVIYGPIDIATVA